MSTTDAPPTSEQLLLQAGCGDETAFARLYDELAPMVFGLARMLTSDYEAAVDISYRTFLALWRDAPGFDPRHGTATMRVARETRRQAMIRLTRRSARRDGLPPTADSRCRP